MGNKTEKITPEQSHNSLGVEQNAEAFFLNSLVGILRNMDLAKLDLRGRFTERMHREYSVLVDNYEISVRRTPVYAYPRKWNRIFSFGKWVFEKDKYERYQLDISENVYDARQEDYGQNRTLQQQDNQIMLCGTMATDLGQYNPSKIYINRSSKEFEDLFVKQNAHLFSAARALYDILDTEYELRQVAIRSHCLPPIDTPMARAAARTRLLKKLESKSR